MKTISMDYNEYQSDLKREFMNGYKNAVTSMVKSLETKDAKEKIEYIADITGFDNRLFERVCKALNIDVSERGINGGE